MKHRVNRYFALSIVMLVAVSFYACKRGEGTSIENATLSLDITSMEKTLCVMSGCGTSDFSEGGNMSMNSSNTLTIEGTVSDETVSSGTYTISFSCGSLSGGFTVSDGSFEFSYPVSGKFIPDECQSAITAEGQLEGQIILSINNQSASANQTIQFNVDTLAAD